MSDITKIIKSGEEAENKKFKKFLPIGTVVLLENGSKKVMITRILSDF